MDKLPSDTTIWRILRKFESNEDRNLNFTGRGAAGGHGSGKIVYQMPVVHIVGRELSTFGDLQKTLAGVGVNSGSVFIRLSFKTTDQPIHEAQAEIAQYFKEEEAATSGSANSEAQPAETVEGVTDAIAGISSAEPTGEDSDMKDQPADSEFTADAETSSLATPSKQSAPSTPEPIIGPDQRPITVYVAPSSNVPQAALQPHNEDDYEPSIALAKLHQSRLLNNSQNKRLLSDKEAEQAEKEKAAKLASLKSVDIKLQFPDQTHMRVPFNADDTAADLYRWVSGVIEAGDQPFKLVWRNPGPLTIPKDEKDSRKKLIRDLGLTGKVVVNLSWEDGASESARTAPTLKSVYLKEAKEVIVPPIAPADAQDEEVPSTVDKGKGKENSEAGGMGKKGMPKWLKGLSKK